MIAVAWFAGELAQRWKVPRVAVYALVGFAFGRVLPGPAAVSLSGAAALLPSVAFGLVLFEFGYRINLRWFRVNPWLAATGLLDVALTFPAVYALCRIFGAAPISSALMAAMATATSPASLTRVVNELRSSGQVTERALHLTAFNCLCALLAFKFIVGFWTLGTSGDVLKALSNSIVVLLVSAGLGSAFGTGMPAVLRVTGRGSTDATRRSWWRWCCWPASRTCSGSPRSWRRSRSGWSRATDGSRSTRRSGTSACWATCWWSSSSPTWPRRWNGSVPRPARRWAPRW
ncbi:hypothetical protein HK414_24400 [Ramlibacter terrae]|uniref:Cation/H+ exchanger domain-containing protein n=1 Tax=Ramlibacter terrae TaxID=2732511 RepID=A0ABX6P5G7_9BURK|nr:hypothetical protein HK414_24400 [Ramlibacter terrae]